MGTQGEFKEYAYTGSYNATTRQTYMFDSVYSATNPPPPGSILISDTVSRNGSWHSIFFVSASTFTALSGSLQGVAATNVFPTNSQINGNFVTIKLATGIIIAAQ